MKKRIVGVASLCVTLIAYFVFRYLLFEWHGMKQFPVYLLIVGIIVIVVSGLIKGNRITPIFTTAGYIVGFFVGHLLAVTSYDPGVGILNNMWQIWISLYAIAIIAGVLIEIFNGKKHKAQ